jgi:hypothetical protein
MPQAIHIDGQLSCSGCGQPIYANGDGVWFGADGEAMCVACGDATLTPEPRRWNPDKGCWEIGETA